MPWYGLASFALNCQSRFRLLIVPHPKSSQDKPSITISRKHEPAAWHCKLLCDPSLGKNQPFVGFRACQDRGLRPPTVDLCKEPLNVLQVCESVLNFLAPFRGLRGPCRCRWAWQTLEMNAEGPVAVARCSEDLRAILGQCGFSSARSLGGRCLRHRWPWQWGCPWCLADF